VPEGGAAGDAGGSGALVALRTALRGGPGGGRNQSQRAQNRGAGNRERARQNGPRGKTLDLASNSDFTLLATTPPR